MNRYKGDENQNSLQIQLSSLGLVYLILEGTTCLASF